MYGSTLLLLAVRTSTVVTPLKEQTNKQTNNPTKPPPPQKKNTKNKTKQNKNKNRQIDPPRLDLLDPSFP